MESPASAGLDPIGRVGLNTLWVWGSCTWNAVSRSRGHVQMRLGRCLRCERWRWATTIKLDRPWANGYQAGFYLQCLRGEVLAQLY